MTQPPTNLTARQLELVDELAALQSRIAGLRELEDSVKNELRQLGRGSFGFNGGPALVSITQATKFDPLKGAQFLTPEEVESCMRMTLDAKAVKEKLTTEEIRAASTPEATLRVQLKGGE